MNEAVARQCLKILVSGHVQGVCFRHFTRQKAVELGITGWVRNLPNGDVEALICAAENQLIAMQAWLAVGPEHAHVTECRPSPCNSAQQLEAFTILS
ncbi:MAG: acylphosphatase [Mariprofundaceae bacterium]|nr:acylphosphatase [Mariprofundaceae bacterium]